MKKVITLCLFVCALFLGSQTVVAQNQTLETKLEVNTKAAEKSQAISKFVKCSDDQRNQMYVALQTYEGNNLAKDPSREDIDKNQTRLDQAIKSILNDEQFERYKLYKAENQ